MAHRLQTFGELQQYFRGVNQRARHHAKNVRDVLDALFSMVVLYADAPPVCRTYRKERQTRMTNVIRFVVGGRPVALTYNHEGVVELHNGTEVDGVIATFDNDDTTTDVRAAFAEFFGPVPCAPQGIVEETV